MLGRCTEREYTVEHADETGHRYRIPVPSLPVLPFTDDLKELVESAPLQPFRGSLLLRSEQMSLKTKIKATLKRRSIYDDVNKASWASFFQGLPKEDDQERPELHPKVLAELLRLYGRKRGARPVFERTNTDLNDYGVIDVVQYPGGPMENSEYVAYRRSIKDGDRGCIRKRKCDYSDSSDDDAPNKRKAVAVPKSGDVLHTKIALDNDISECEKETNNCYGESNCGRPRLALACLTKKIKNRTGIQLYWYRRRC